MNTFGNVDTAVNALTGSGENPVPLFVSLMNGTETEYKDNLEKVKTEALNLVEL